MNDRLSIRSLAVQGLRFSFGSRPVLEDITFRATAGELLAIVGPNGCGKSTLLRLLVGELLPSAGSLLIDDQPASTLGRPGIAQRMALVPQQLNAGAADFGYTVREIVLMARHPAHAQGRGWLNGNGMGFETPDDLLLAERAMWAADVHHLADRPLDTLSGGERQRVATARAFTQDTPILLLDEPTSALDLYHQLELLDQFRIATQEESRLVILVTHDLNLAAAHATRTIVMDRGRLIADGPTAEVLTPAVLEPVYQVQVRRTRDAGLLFSRKPDSAPSP